MRIFIRILVAVCLYFAAMGATGNYVIDRYGYKNARAINIMCLFWPVYWAAHGGNSFAQILSD